MTDLNPASFDDYKSFILAREKQAKAFERGFRRRLAEALGCQSAFITQVLGGSAHLSLEQGFKAAGYFGLSGTAQRYFLTLIEVARAGTAELKTYFEAQLNELKSELLDLRRNVAASSDLSDAGKVIYYSHWMYAAVHILVTIPKYQAPQLLAAPLGLKEEQVREALKFLMEAGLVKMEKGRLQPGQIQLHLSRSSELIRQHHTQWRLRAIDHIARTPAKDVHYSTVSSLSVKDFEALKSKMVEWIRSYTETVRDSKEEELCAFNLDCYRLT